MKDAVLKSRTFIVNDRHQFEVVARLVGEGRCAIQAQDDQGRPFGRRVTITATDFNGGPGRLSDQSIDFHLQEIADGVLFSNWPTQPAP